MIMKTYLSPLKNPENFVKNPNPSLTPEQKAFFQLLLFNQYRQLLNQLYCFLTDGDNFFH